MDQALRCRLFPLRSGPDSVGEMAVMFKSRNDMPVQVGDLVAERGQIYFVRLKPGDEHLLDRKDDGHQLLALARFKLSHFSLVLPPDYPAKPRIIWLLSIDDTNFVALP